MKSTTIIQGVTSAALLAATTILGGAACGSPPSATQEGSSMSTAALRSGADVFRGLYFNEGPVAPLLPVAWTSGTQALQSREQSIAQLEYALGRMKAEGWSAALIAQTESALHTLQSGRELETITPEQSASLKRLVMARIEERDASFFDRFGAEMQSGDHLRVEAAMKDATSRTNEVLRALGQLEPGSGPSPQNRCIVTSIVTFVYINFVYFFFNTNPSQPGTNDGRLAHDEMVDGITRSLAVVAPAGANRASASTPVCGGADVFRAVFFHDGPVARLVDPEAASAASPGEASSPGEAARTEARVLDQLAAKDPGFFDRFAVEMQSGDPLRVDAAELDAEERLKVALALLGAGEPGGYTVDNKGLIVGTIQGVIIDNWEARVIELPQASNGRLGRAERMSELAARLRSHE